MKEVTKELIVALNKHLDSFIEERASDNQDIYDLITASPSQFEGKYKEELISDLNDWLSRVIWKNKQDEYLQKVSDLGYGAKEKNGGN